MNENVSQRASNCKHVVDVTHKCGHTQSLLCTGDVTQDRLLEQHIRDTECAICKFLDSLKQDEAVPEMQGSAEQCIIAERLRDRAIAAANERMEDSIGEEDEHSWRRLIRHLEQQGDAAWWIRHRNDAIETVALKMRNNWDY